eukprot:3439184-Pyramimonas_sp.AAC.1
MPRSTHISTLVVSKGYICAPGVDLIQVLVLLPVDDERLAELEVVGARLAVLAALLDVDVHVHLVEELEREGEVHEPLGAGPHDDVAQVRGLQQPRRLQHVHVLERRVLDVARDEPRLLLRRLVRANIPKPTPKVSIYKVSLNITSFYGSSCANNGTGALNAS